MPVPRADLDSAKRSGGFSLPEPHLPLRAVAFDGSDELLRKRVDHACADAMEAARRFVTAMLELPAGVQHREDHLERALLGRRVLVDGNATTIVLDRDSRAVGVERHVNVGGVAVHDLVDGVVEDFPDKMVQPVEPTPPMYMPGRLRTGSRPSRTVMSLAV